MASLFPHVSTREMVNPSSFRNSTASKSQSCTWVNGECILPKLCDYPQTLCPDLGSSIISLNHHAHTEKQVNFSRSIWLVFLPCFFSCLHYLLLHYGSHLCTDAGVWWLWSYCNHQCSRELQCNETNLWTCQCSIDVSWQISSHAQSDPKGDSDQNVVVG